MKKLIKIIAIVFGIILAIGMIGIALETPEQKAERELKSKVSEAEQKDKEKSKVSEVAAKQTEQTEQKDKEKLEVERVDDFGITPNKLNDEITKLLNDALKENHSSGKVSVDEDRFKREYDEHFVWGGNINKDGNVSKVIYAITNSKDLQTHTTLLLFHAGATARVLSPNLPKEETAGKVGEMIIGVVKKTADTQKDASGEIVVDGYKYSVNIMPSIGAVVAVIERQS